MALDGLLILTSFYSGKCKIGFPELESVVVNGCFEMQSFLDINGIISTPKVHKSVVDNNTTMGASYSTHINRHHTTFLEEPPWYFTTTTLRSKGMYVQTHVTMHFSQFLYISM